MPQSSAATTAPHQNLLSRAKDVALVVAATAIFVTSVARGELEDRFGRPM